MSNLTQAEVWSCLLSDAALAFPGQTNALTRYLNSQQGEEMLRHYREAGESQYTPNTSTRLASQNPALARLERIGREIAEREGISEAAGLAKASIDNQSLYNEYREAQRKEAQRHQQRLAKQRQDELAREMRRRGLTG